MIYSITLNPSIDYVVTSDQLFLGRVNRLTETTKLPGGKGINVSRILQALAVPTVALGFLGGFTGDFIKNALKADDLPCDFTPIAADTRINVKLRAESETELNAPGPRITDDEQHTFITALTERLQPGDVVVMAGSLPPDLPASFYRDLIPAIHTAHAEFVIDTTGQALLDTLADHPLVVKPNHHELAALFNDAPYPSIEATVQAGRKLLTLGAQHVLVSMAGKGALLIEADRAYHGNTKPQQVINSVGAGDSMLAGFTGRLTAGATPLEAFKTALACGSATAYSQDLATREKIDDVLATVTVKEV
ncbi:1-phosphofructokinase [Lacticaseibacillus mingshuiensis]|uniref:Tagatose-6-phosphate kinase n=1 Tax=Lacticaseibacillus mingshuiensis TaxID=2799574 RepID=A0ABW4CFN8_9LACO|nr:1-phosphofructokinase [Lacticaseibacillus mingshuiensis]